MPHLKIQDWPIISPVIHLLDTDINTYRITDMNMNP